MRGLKLMIITAASIVLFALMIIYAPALFQNATAVPDRSARGFPYWLVNSSAEWFIWAGVLLVVAGFIIRRALLARGKKDERTRP